MGFEFEPLSVYLNQRENGTQFHFIIFAYIWGLFCTTDAVIHVKMCVKPIDRRAGPLPMLSL